MKFKIPQKYALSKIILAFYKFLKCALELKLPRNLYVCNCIRSFHYFMLKMKHAAITSYRVVYIYIYIPVFIKLTNRSSLCIIEISNFG